MRKLITIALTTTVILSSCREDEFVVYSDQQTVASQEGTNYSGLYLLNEGNMGSNHCTLDYLDFATSIYHRNIYAQRNPRTVKELGDVGNDLQINGDQLWMVINCSNKVEVCHLNDASRIGQVNIPNCRNVIFHQNFAYISSFVGPVSLTQKAQQGRIYKVDTHTLQIVDSVTVGFQPEEMGIIDNRIYSANSGGYLLPAYSNTLSQINLETFKEEKQIIVGTNPHRIEADHHHQLWVSTRGNYADIHPALYCLSLNANGVIVVTDSLPIAISDMQLVGDTLWYFGANWNAATQQNNVQYGMIDVRTHQPITTTLFDDAEIAHITVPYGLLVNPIDKDFYLMDAKNYVSSGQLLHFNPDGTFDWKVWTGDIPSRAVLVDAHPTFDTDTIEPILTHPYIAGVDEYVPAPGQFINSLPIYEAGDNAATMAEKCTQAIAHNAKGLVSLGGFGGYLTFHFDGAVRNIVGEKDFQIFGNAMAGSSEPGIVMVSIDSNNNGLPDDEWYELAGSADTDSIGKVHYGYEVTYVHKEMQDIPWSDNLGRMGTIARNTFHPQEYFPLWLDSPLTLSGTLLPRNGFDQSGNGTHWVTIPLRYGYVDNLSDDEGCSFDLDWAVHPDTRQKVHLTHADFVRVYCAQNQQCGWLGETSTEISGAKIIAIPFNKQ